MDDMAEQAAWDAYANATLQTIITHPVMGGRMSTTQDVGTFVQFVESHARQAAKYADAMIELRAKRIRLRVRRAEMKAKDASNKEAEARITGRKRVDASTLKPGDVWSFGTDTLKWVIENVGSMNGNLWWWTRSKRYNGTKTMRHYWFLEETHGSKTVWLYTVGQQETKRQSRSTRG